LTSVVINPKEESMSYSGTEDKKTILLELPSDLEVEIKIILEPKKRIEEHERENREFSETRRCDIEENSARGLVERIIRAEKLQTASPSRDAFSVTPAEAFGMKVYALRQKKGISSEKFSEKAGLTMDDLLSIEFGLAPMNKVLKSLEQLDKALGQGTEIKRLFFGLVF